MTLAELLAHTAGTGNVVVLGVPDANIAERLGPLHEGHTAGEGLARHPAGGNKVRGGIIAGSTARPSDLFGGGAGCAEVEYAP